MIAAAIAVGIYLLAGLWHALRWVDWRNKTFSFSWLPPAVPGERSWNARLAHLTIGILVTVLWPVYRLAWRMTPAERSARLLEELERIDDANRSLEQLGSPPLGPDPRGNR